MNDIAILFIYTHKCPLTNTNYESIVKHSGDMPIYAIHQNDFSNYFYPELDYRHISQWGGRDIWYWGSDNIFLYWYLSNPDKRAKQYLILEYDTYVTQDIKEFLNIDQKAIDHSGIMSAYSIFAKSHTGGYWWFDAQRFHPLIDKFYGWNKFAACSPLCANMISDDAVQIVLEHIREIPLANKLYVETKFATILNYLNYNLSNYNLKNSNKYISYSTDICLDNIISSFSDSDSQKLSGMYHPIKDIKIIEKYFMNKKFDKKQISKALFGQIHDVTSGVKFMKDFINTKSLIIDNSMFGDPSPGFHKKLYLKYKKNGQIYNKTMNEGETLDFEDL